MYHHHEVIQKFKWEHPYLLTMLESFIVLIIATICAALVVGPILVAIFLHWSGIFSSLITIPLAVTIIKYVSDLFIF